MIFQTFFKFECFCLRPMEINFLVRVGARMDFFLPHQNISSFIADCFFQQQSTRKWQDMAFDCAQVLEWVIFNNCINCYLAFFPHFWTISTVRRYMPILWSCGTRFWVLNLRLFYLKISDKSWWKSRIWLSWTQNSTSRGLTAVVH